MTTHVSATNPSRSEGLSGVAAIDHWASVVDRGTARELSAIAGGSDLTVLWTCGTAIFPSLLGINKAALFAAFPLSDVCLFGAQLPARDSFCLLYANLPAWDSLCLLGDGAIALVSSAYDCLFGAQLPARDSFCLLYANLPAWDSLCLLGDGAIALVSSAYDCLFGDGATLALVFLVLSLLWLGLLTPLMGRQAAETRPPTAADAERLQKALNTNQFTALPNTALDIGLFGMTPDLATGGRGLEPRPALLRPAPRQVRARRGFGARPLLAVALFAMCAVGESTSREHHDDVPLAVGVVRSTLFDGLPPEFATPLDQVLDNRLAPSSMRKVRRAAKVWCVFAAEHGWPGLLRSDDPQRGAKLAAFVLMLVMTTKLAYSSISKYMWGLATWCVLQRQADPRIGVEGFKSFMNSVKVLTFVPAQPHEAIPIEILERILLNLDKKIFADAQLGFLLDYLLFSFNRAETPLSKAKTGPTAYEPETGFNADDFRVERNATTKWKFLAKARQRRTKTDARMERPEARGAGDWAHIGDVPEEFAIFRIADWYRHLMVFHPRRRGSEEPFFVDPRLFPDGTAGESGLGAESVWTYGQALDMFHNAQLAVGVPAEELYSFHGIRVTGYNLSKSGNGESITVAHGNWKSSAHNRYERFKPSRVADIPAGMMRARDYSGEVRDDDDDDDDAYEGGPGEFPMASESEPGSGSDNDDASDDSDVADEVRPIVAPVRRLSRRDLELARPVPSSVPTSSGAGASAAGDEIFSPVRALGVRRGFLGPIPLGVSLAEHTVEVDRASTRPAPRERARA